MSEKTAGYSVKHRKLGRPGGPGLWKHQGWQLPAYIQNVAHGILRTGKTKSQAIQIAIGKIKDWARGGGDVGPEVVAAAQKALAEWEALKARAAKMANLSNVSDGAMVRAIELATVSYSTGPSKQARAEAQSKGQAFKSGRFPIRNLSDAKKAIHAFGRARPEDKPALKRFIIRRLRALGHPELIPKNWTTREMAALHRQVIELAAGTRDRNIYQRHVRNTKQKGKKKGDLKAKADWEHGYIPKTQTAFALKAKHVSKDDLGPSGKPKPGFSREFNLPIPPHLTKSRTDEARSARERSREPGEAPRQERKAETEEKSKQSVAALRRQRSALEKKVAANTATAAERKRLNQIVAEIKRRAKPAAANPARS